MPSHILLFKKLFLYLQCVTLITYHKMQGWLALDAGIFYACFRYWVYCTPSYLLNGNTASCELMCYAEGKAIYLFLFIVKCVTTKFTFKTNRRKVVWLRR